MTYKAELVFVRLLIPLTAGIILVGQTATSIGFYALPAACISFCILLILNLFYFNLKMNRNKGIAGLLLYLLTFLLGILAGFFHRESDSPTHFSKQEGSYLKVIIDGEP